MTPIDHDAREAALDLRASVAVRAPAGSGKTELLVQRMLACLSICSRPEAVVSLTFSVAAAAEMKRRVIDALVDARDAGVGGVHQSRTRELAAAVVRRDREQGWGLLDNPQRLRVMTIDSLNATLAGQLPLLSGVGTRLDLDERPRLLYEQAVFELLAEYDDPAVDGSIRDAVGVLLQCADWRYDRLVPMLCDLLGKREQWKDAIHAADPMFIEAALHEWIATRLHEAAGILAPHLTELAMAIGLASQDPEWCERFGLVDLPEAEPAQVAQWRALADLLLTQAGGLRRSVNARQGFPPKADATTTLNTLLKSLHDSGEAGTVAHALVRVRCLPDPRFPDSMRDFRSALVTALERLCAHLLTVFEREGRLDFPELAARAQRALGTDEPSDVLCRLDYRIEHLLVDEFQDTNRSQLRLLSRITDGWIPTDGRTLFFVGDPQQSIFLFREAEVRLFVTLLEQGRFEQVALRVVDLVQNFRSDRIPVEWCNDAFRQVFPDRPDLLAGSVAFTESRALQDEGAGEVEVIPRVCRDDEGEAADVIERIQRVRAQDPDATVAVLVRSRAHLTAILPALKEAGIPHSANEIDPITERGAVEDVVHLIRALWHPMDRLSWMRVLRSRVVGLDYDDLCCIAGCAGGKAAIEEGLRQALDAGALSAQGVERAGRVRTVLDEVRASARCMQRFPDMVRSVWYGLGGNDAVDSVEVHDIERVFSRLAESCEAGVLRNMTAFMASLDGLYATASPANVQVMTIHASKGLEFDGVIVAGMGRPPRRAEEPLFYHQVLPHGFVLAPHPGRGPDVDADAERLYRACRQLHMDALDAEARRLLYVALTRARRWLYLLGHAPASKSAGKKGEPRPSPDQGSLLQLLWPAVADHFERAVSTAGARKEGVARPQATEPYVPQALRLPRGHVVSAPSPVFEPRYSRTRHPSEQILTGSKRRGGRHSQDVLARAAGQLYHQLMERVGREGLEAWDRTRLADLHETLCCWSIGEGVAESRSGVVADAVIRLAEQTLDDPQGRWVLGEGGGAAFYQREAQWTGYIGGRWVVAAIDVLVDDDDAVWVVELKTSGALDSRADADRVIPAEVDRYRDQLADYRNLVVASAAYAGRPVRSAIYFPAFQRLEVVDQDHETAVAVTDDACAG